MATLKNSPTLVSQPAPAAAIIKGSGVPASPIVGVASQIYIRTDTPATSSQRLYICTVSGSPGTWVALAV